MLLKRTVWGHTTFSLNGIISGVPENPQLWTLSPGIKVIALGRFATQEACAGTKQGNDPENTDRTWSQEG